MTTPHTVLLLPGQGAQRARMAAGLYGVETTFTDTLDGLFSSLGSRGATLRDVWLGDDSDVRLDTAEFAQPLLFAIGYALGAAVRAVRSPDLLLGHSVGELAAAALADVLPAAPLLAAVAERAGALDEAAAGGMLAVATSPEELPVPLGPDVALAALNGPRQLVLSGGAEALRHLSGLLRAAGIMTKPLRSRHAFHSPAMVPVAEEFAAALAQCGHHGPGVPHLPLLSGRTARRVRRREALDPHFWAGQLALPVRYWPALRALLDAYGEEPGVLLLDGSADRGLSAPAAQHPAVRAGRSRIIPLLAFKSAGGTAADAETFAAAKEDCAAVGQGSIEAQHALQHGLRG